MPENLTFRLAYADEVERAASLCKSLPSRPGEGPVQCYVAVRDEPVERLVGAAFFREIVEGRSLMEFEWSMVSGLIGQDEETAFLDALQQHVERAAGLGAELKTSEWYPEGHPIGLSVERAGFAPLESRSALIGDLLTDLDADPDGDGRDNLMEMAVGSDPNVAQVEQEVPYTVGWEEVSGFYYLKLTVNKQSVQQVSYRVEVSGDLKEWASGPEATATLMDDVSALSVRYLVAFEAGVARFIRLTVER